jgi:hypothetical protein
MSRNLIIGGVALTLLGAGAYLYFKSKNAQKKASGGLLTQGQINQAQAALIASQGSPQSGTTLTTPTQVAQVIDNLQTARELAKQIAAERAKIKPVPPSRPNSGFSSLGAQTQYNLQRGSIIGTNAKAQLEIDRLSNELAKLGYVEVNGQPVKAA